MPSKNNKLNKETIIIINNLDNTKKPNKRWDN